MRLLYIGWYYRLNQWNWSYRIKVCEHEHDNVFGYWWQSFSKIIYDDE